MLGLSIFEPMQQLIPALVVVVVVIALFVWLAQTGRRWALLREAAIIFGGFFAYFAVRGLTEGELATALIHANRLIDLERSLGFFFEPAAQAAVSSRHWIVTLANWVYIWGHWPVIGGVAFWLWRRDASSYRVFRTAFLISGALGLLLFINYPTAPPRLAGLGLIDTLTEYSRSYNLLQPKSIVNQYAAFPSLHFGWNMLVAIAIISQVRRFSVRMLAAFMPVAMLVSIVLTANHFWIDAVAGAFVALIGLGVALYFNRTEPAAVELHSWIRARQLEERTTGLRDIPIAFIAPDSLARTADGV